MLLIEAIFYEDSFSNAANIGILFLKNEFKIINSFIYNKVDKFCVINRI